MNLLFKKVLFLIISFLYLSISVSAQYNVNRILFNAHEFYLANKLNLALEQYNLAIKYKPESYDAYFMRGVVKYNLSDYRGAILDFNKALEINPFSPDSFFNRGLAKQMIGNLDAALKDFDKAIDTDPSGFKYYLSRGIVYIMQNKPELALKDINNSTRMGLELESSYYYKGLAKSVLKDFKSALIEFDEALKLNSFNADAYLRRGLVKIELSDYEAALLDINKALKINNKFSFAYFNKAFVYLKLENKLEAIKNFEKVTEIDPQNAQALYNVAALKVELNQKTEAIEILRKVITINPNNVMVILTIGNILMDLGRNLEAIQFFNKAIEIYPEFASAYNNRSIAKNKLGDKKGAAIDFDRAKKIDKKLIKDQNTNKEQFAQLIELKSDFRNDIQQSESLVGFSTNLLPRFHLLSIGNIQKRQVSEITTYLEDPNNSFLFKFVNNIKFSNSDSLQKQFNSILLLNDQVYKNIKLSSINILLSDFNSAVENFNELIELKPKFGFAYFGRATVKFEMFDFIHSIEKKNEIDLVLFSSNSSTSNKVQRNKVEDDFSEILNDFNKAIELEPIFPCAYFNRAELMIRQNKISLAIQDYRDAIRQNPDFKEAYFNLGVLLLVQLNDKNGCVELSRAGELGYSQAYSIIKKYCD